MNETNRDFMTVLLKYGLLFFLIFAIVFLLAVLTPWMAKQVDKIIARIKSKPQPAEDPRCAQVRGIYDMPPAPREETDSSAEDTNDTDSSVANTNETDKEKNDETHTM